MSFAKESNPKEKSDPKKSPDAVETPPPPQHMDPSEKPVHEMNKKQTSKSSQK